MRVFARSPESEERTADAWQWFRCAAWLCAGLIVAGCKGSGDKPTVDETVGRYAQKGSVAYAEGQIDEAIRDYRRAIHRAWAIDDAYESGTNAYNLAACMLSAGRTAEAKDWLLDSRVELCRAGASAGNVHLLEAKLALHESRLEDVYRHVDQADCADPPCAGEGCECEDGPDDPCRDGCVTKIPCIGPKIKDARATKDCENAFQAQVELTRARLAAEQYDIPCALAHLSKACQLLDGICGHDLQADLHDVAALIHLAKDEYLQAACHLDREATSLRCAGIYREIPTTLELAAAAYEQAGRFDLAAKRLCRAARIWFGRGDVDRAWEVVRSASNLAGDDQCDVTQVRLALLAQEISQSLAKEKPTATAPRQDSNATKEGSTGATNDSVPTRIDDRKPSHDSSKRVTEEPLPQPLNVPLPDPQTTLDRLDGPRNQMLSEPSEHVTRLPSQVSSKTVVVTPASSSQVKPEIIQGATWKTNLRPPNPRKKMMRYFPGSPSARPSAIPHSVHMEVQRLKGASGRRTSALQIDPTIPSSINRSDWPSLRSGNP